MLDNDSIIGVVGAGTMGAGIAQVAATQGHQVFLYDAFPKQLSIAEDGLKKILARQIEKQRMTQTEVDGILNRIHFVDTIKDFKSCDLAIEAVVEKPEIKKDVFARLEAIVTKNCIL